MTISIDGIGPAALAIQMGKPAYGVVLKTLIICNHSQGAFDRPSSEVPPQRGPRRMSPGRPGHRRLRFRSHLRMTGETARQVSGFHSAEAQPARGPSAEANLLTHRCISATLAGQVGDGRCSLPCGSPSHSAEDVRLPPRDFHHSGDTGVHCYAERGREVRGSIVRGPWRRDILDVHGTQNRRALQRARVISTWSPFARSRAPIASIRCRAGTKPRGDGKVESVG